MGCPWNLNENRVCRPTTSAAAAARPLRSGMSIASRREIFEGGSRDVIGVLLRLSSAMLETLCCRFYNFLRSRGPLRRRPRIGHQQDGLRMVQQLEDKAFGCGVRQGVYRASIDG